MERTRRSSYDRHSREKGSSKKYLWLLIPAVVILGGILLYGLSVGFSGTPDDRDHAVLLKASDLKAFIDDLSVDPAAERVSKTHYLDGSFDVEYEYDPPGDDGFYLNCIVDRERNSRDARTTYTAYQWGASLGISLASGPGPTLKEEERNDIFSWGDQSKFVIYTYEGNPVGNLFVTRKGKRVFCLQLTGIFFDDGEAFGELVVPKLEKLSAY